MADDDKIRAPWGPTVVDRLNAFQRSGLFHEFTCPAVHIGADRALVATRRGWVCPHCDYTQDWAPASMADPLPQLGAGHPSPPRDLVLHIDRITQNHIAYPQAADAVRHLRDHLQALAFVEETNKREGHLAAGLPPPVCKR
ncbi:hypothetical protein [Bradyrhizobium sp. 1(2017)]|uniref:hypothetical protein n=1 Tax=Bradyrhizobium sp. 1(2017) TaxID=1404888 RepID=UPI00140F4838|nr:hypothetical protein [Bradyrhizobium sp. 1(2017)]QIO34360.1 hypothetical protein HAP40_22450 [Bradyrhizobium sp. 1(2017)]